MKSVQSKTAKNTKLKNLATGEHLSAPNKQCSEDHEKKPLVLKL